MSFREPSKWRWWPNVWEMTPDEILTKAKEHLPYCVILEEVGTPEITTRVIRDFVEKEVEGEWTVLFHRPKIKDYANWQSRPSDIYLFFELATDAMRARLILS